MTVLSSLIAVQDAIHYLPDEAIKETATFCGSSINDVWSVASFYTNFRFTPPGEKTLDVCWGPSCHLVGAQQILDAVQGVLEIKEEGESPDRKVTLKYNTCLGACAQGPVIAIVKPLPCALTNNVVPSGEKVTPVNSVRIRL